MKVLQNESLKPKMNLDEIIFCIIAVVTLPVILAMPLLVYSFQAYLKYSPLIYGIGLFSFVIVMCAIIRHNANPSRPAALPPLRGGF